MLTIRSSRRQRGATLVEFALAAALVLLPLALLTLQLALLGVTRRVLDVAVEMTARAGAAANGSQNAMRAALARAVLPLHVSAASFTTDNYRPAAAAAIEEVTRGENVTLTIVAPRRLAIGGEIPNEGFDRRRGAGAARNAALLRDNLLTIDLQYCAPMIVPIASSIIVALLRSESDDAFADRCYQQQRMPMRLRNTQVMQSVFRGG